MTLPQQATPGSALALTDAKRRAVEMLAEGGQTYSQIARELGIDRMTLIRWRKEPAFRDALEELNAAIAAEMSTYLIARKHERVGAKDRRWQLLEQILRERGEDYEGTTVAGGSTGLIQRRVKTVGGGSTAYHVDEFELDAAMLKAFNDLEKSTAEELGDLKTKVELDAQIDATVGPVKVIRIHDQKVQPYTANREGMDEPGRYEKREDGNWYDVRTGLLFDPGITATVTEAEFREISEVDPAEEQTGGDAAASALRWLREQHAAGNLTDEELERARKELGDA